MLFGYGYIKDHDQIVSSEKMIWMPNSSNKAYIPIPWQLQHERRGSVFQVFVSGVLLQETTTMQGVHRTTPCLVVSGICFSAVSKSEAADRILSQ